MSSNDVVVFCNMALKHELFPTACMEQHYVWTRLLSVWNGMYGQSFICDTCIDIYYLEGIRTTIKCTSMGNINDSRLQTNRSF